MRPPKIQFNKINDVNEKRNANWDLQNYLYNEFSGNSTDPRPYSSLYPYFPNINDGDIVQFVNGTADIHSPHASHLRCLISYALEFILLGKRVHLIIANIPSNGNYTNWLSTKRFSYLNYINLMIKDISEINPF